MTTYVNEWNQREGSFQLVGSVDVKVGDALKQGLLDQITDHVGDCSDSNLRQRNGRPDDLVDMNDYVRCPRCALVSALRPNATGYLLNSTLKLRVIVQIKHRSAFDDICWD